MAEFRVLLPEQPNMIPDELLGVFEVIKHVFDQETPIRKSTQIIEISDQYREGILPNDAFFWRNMDTPRFDFNERYHFGNPTTHPQSGTYILEGGRDNEYSKIVFTESHATGKAAESIYPDVTGCNVWQLGVQVSMLSDTGRRSLTDVTANSLGQSVGKTISWAGGENAKDVHTEFLFSTGRFEEIALAAGKILVPTLD